MSHVRSNPLLLLIPKPQIWWFGCSFPALESLQALLLSLEVCLQKSCIQRPCLRMHLAREYPLLLDQCFCAELNVLETVQENEGMMELVVLYAKITPFHEWMNPPIMIPKVCNKDQDCRSQVYRLNIQILTSLWFSKDDFAEPVKISWMVNVSPHTSF